MLGVCREVSCLGGLVLSKQHHCLLILILDCSLTCGWYLTHNTGHRFPGVVFNYSPGLVWLLGISDLRLQGNFCIMNLFCLFYFNEACRIGDVCTSTMHGKPLDSDSAGSEISLLMQPFFQGNDPFLQPSIPASFLAQPLIKWTFALLPYGTQSACSSV